MTSVSSTALSGLRAAQLQLDSSAHNVANLNTPGFKRQTVELQEEPEQGGVRASLGRAQNEGSALETDAVDQMAATYSFAANLQVFKAQDRMMGALLDQKA
ncbi:flagellar basal body protein [Paenacidovorax monticola]|uniref:Flagellar basal body rod protein n=1 Tax=Paenacidovorax monticola TaxID=1926868 RepID=A0A7H0HDB8_9BURK|nr:flagellar basal body protein [Paenacidovorax monticola]MBO9678737.1 flagellar basal body rod protein [Acidovorax sp.]QNP58534.1 flagellar basal body rod protein [Paenacidovorax monticola]